MMVGSQSQRFVTPTAAATPVPNILAGTQYEYVSVPSVISVYACSDAGDQTAEVVLGQRRVLPPSPVPGLSVADALSGPDTNKHQIVKSPVMPGERIQLSYVGGAGALPVRALVVIDPIP